MSLSWSLKDIFPSEFPLSPSSHYMNHRGLQALEYDIFNPWGCPRVTVVVCTKFVLARTARYIVHMLKLWCHYTSLVKFYNLKVWIVLASLYLKVRVIFCYAACKFVWAEICFQCNCSVRRLYMYVKTAVPLCFLW